MPDHIEYPAGKPPRIRIVVPPDLRQAVGKIMGKPGPVTNLRESLGTHDPEEIKRRAPAVTARLLAIIDEARKASDPETLAKALIDRHPPTTNDTASIISRASALGGVIYGDVPADRQEPVRAIINQHFDDRDIYIGRLDLLCRLVKEERWQEVRAAVAEFDPDPTRETGGPVVDTEAIINAWIAERKAGGHDPKPKAIENKRRKVARLLAFTKRAHLGAVTETDLAGYRLHLLEQGGTIARDHLLDIKALFVVAYDNNLIRPNPSTEIKLPAKTDNPRPPFSAAEARKILIAARDAEPMIRWAHWLAAFTTAINSEILEAKASEFYRTESGQWVFDMRQRKLKTGFRPRIIPLHPAILREGFLDYLRTRDGKMLFDGNTDYNTNKLNDSIHDLGITKSFYSWRHRVTHQLGDGSMARYIAGHAAKDIHEKFYHHHDLPDEFCKIVAMIEALPDPTVDWAKP